MAFPFPVPRPKSRKPGRRVRAPPTCRLTLLCCSSHREALLPKTALLESSFPLTRFSRRQPASASAPQARRPLSCRMLATSASTRWPLLSRSRSHLKLALQDRVQTIRFPAVYARTAEAVLLMGSLVQLGDDEVRLLHDDLEVEGIDITRRLNVYRDETSIPWEQLATAPIRVLLQQVQGLKVCKDAARNQSCGMFHPSLEEEIDQVFLNVWVRQYAKLSGVKVKPADADIFQAYVRVPASTPGLEFNLNLVPSRGLDHTPRGRRRWNRRGLAHRLCGGAVGKGFVLLTKLKDQPCKSQDAGICASSQTIQHILL